MLATLTWLLHFFHSFSLAQGGTQPSDGAMQFIILFNRGHARGFKGADAIDGSSGGVHARRVSSSQLCEWVIDEEVMVFRF